MFKIESHRAQTVPKTFFVFFSGYFCLEKKLLNILNNTDLVMAFSKSAQLSGIETFQPS